MGEVSDLIGEAWRARREGRPGDARRLLMLVIEGESAEPRELVSALVKLSHIERDSDETGAAHAALERALTIARGMDDRLLTAACLRHLGDTHVEGGRAERAESRYREALALYRADRSTPIELANAVRPLAVLLHGSGRGREARPLFEEARSLYASAGNAEGVDECDAYLRA